MMERIILRKGDQTMLVKNDRINRFLEQGWQLVAEPAPKKPEPKVEVKAQAEVKKKVPKTAVEDINDEFDWEPPLVSMPTDNQ
jgi:hypothetical protein